MLVRTLRSRGSTIVVEAHSEVTFLPGGPLTRFENRFSNKLTATASKLAPRNSRPRWSHYGPPLHTTFTSRTKVRPDLKKIWSAVGSTAPYALYVNSGTGIFGGNGPYPAKILPPWFPTSDSLYEHTWSPGSPNNPRVRPVMIKGQPGQQFMEKARDATMAFMKVSWSRGGPMTPKMAAAEVSRPPWLTDFSGATPVTGTFISNLQQWRAWRDASFAADYRLGTNRTKRRTRRVGDGTRKSRARPGYGQIRRTEAQNEARREASRIRSQQRRDRLKAMRPESRGLTDHQRLMRARATERARFITKVNALYGPNRVVIDTLEFRDGRYWVQIREDYTAQGGMLRGYFWVKGKQVTIRGT